MKALEAVRRGKYGDKTAQRRDCALGHGPFGHLPTEKGWQPVLALYTSLLCETGRGLVKNRSTSSL